MSVDVFSKGFMFRNSIKDNVDHNEYVSFMYDQYQKYYDQIVVSWLHCRVSWPFPRDMTLEEFTRIFESE